MKVKHRQPPSIERCPYLGLHDDESTCLAYASAWNYCYHAAPPRSVILSQQREICLGPQYVECVVMLSNQWGPLPRGLRGKARGRPRLDGSSRRGTWLLLFLLLLVAILALIVWLDPSIVKLLGF